MDRMEVVRKMRNNLTPRHQLVRIAALTLLGAVIAWKGIVPALTRIDTDFPNYYAASRLLLDGERLDHLYDNSWFGARAVQLGLSPITRFTPFPPSTVFVMLPVAWLPPLTALQAWTIFNMGILVAVIFLLSAITGKDRLWSATLVLAGGWALINNFRFGQVYLCLLFALLLIYRGMQRDTSVAAGIALGAGAVVKYFPVIYLLPLAARKQWRTIAVAVASMMALTGATLVVVGVPANVEFFSRVVIPHAQGALPETQRFSAAYESWNSMLGQLFVYDAVENPTPMFDMPIAAVILRSLITVLVVGMSVYAWRRAGADERGLARRVAVLTVGAFVLLPNSTTYHYCLFILPVALLLAGPGAWTARERCIALGYGVIGFLPYALFRSFEGHGILTILAYPRLWLVSAIFAAAVWPARPNDHARAT